MNSSQLSTLIASVLYCNHGIVVPKEAQSSIRNVLDLYITDSNNIECDDVKSSKTAAARHNSLTT